MTTLAPVLTPHGRLLLVPAEDAAPLPDDVAQRLQKSFARGSGHGLLLVGGADLDTLPPALAYWRDLATGYVTSVCTHTSSDSHTALPDIPPPPFADLQARAAAAPPMTGSEYLTADVLMSLWADIDAAFRVELRASKLTVEDFLKRLSPAWNLVGRVHFNLAENRADDEAPFAFLATYTAGLSARAQVQHMPLGRALTEYAGAANKSALLSLLLPVQRAAVQCPWLQAMVDAGDIYHPLRWTPAEAFRLLQDLPRLEAAGVIVRVPRTWASNRPARPRVSATVGTKAPAGLGTDALLDFRMAVTLDGETLTRAEITRLLAQSDGLHLLRGRWVEVDRARLSQLLAEFRSVEKTAARDGLTFAEAMRTLTGASIAGGPADAETAEWSRVSAGPWLAQTLAGLRDPAVLAPIEAGAALNATLRPYQQVGVRWLHLLSTLGLGACLADDMGLGKTMQVLALLLVLRKQKIRARRPSVLVAPASLLANWAAEIERFAPTLRIIVAHTSVMSPAELRALEHEDVSKADLVITSYGTLARVPALLQTQWHLAILDEAQAIKNAGTRQARAAKQLDARARIALTGTPVENSLGDLWSIFDFINPGLLGSGKDFTRFTKRLAERPHNPYAPLRELVRPYILRRLKTDRSVIADLPDKAEVSAFCALTRKQAALYQSAVDELAHELTKAQGMRRRGIVLAFLMRFKQICNHPSQWLGDGAWSETDSGKFVRLREIAEVIAAKQEKVLIFTQFRETTMPLAGFLASVFGRAGLVLHGGTAVKKRSALVQQFQQDEEIPFFVISLKAGGSGLNLTAASHVIHFDRWWNPAVENQATDRAFRIGQKKNVLVHKFLCRGTIEEKVDALVDSKRQLSRDLLEGGAEVLLTELNDAELLQLVALDLHAATLE